MLFCNFQGWPKKALRRAFGTQEASQEFLGKSIRTMGGSFFGGLGSAKVRQGFNIFRSEGFLEGPNGGAGIVFSGQGDPRWGPWSAVGPQTEPKGGQK